MLNKTVFAALGVAAFLGAGLWYVNRAETGLPNVLDSSASAQEATASSEAQAIPDMVLGKAEAPITVVEYASYTCPHCQNFHETVFDKLKADYIDTGKVKFVYREVYFDKYGLWAAMVARCGGETKYFGISDMIYNTQKEWIGDGQDATIAGNLRKIGLKAGIAPDALEACLNDNDTAKAMVATYQANAQKDDINSTPSFVIDGKKYSNMSYEDFAKILDDKLAN
jgi:protein-disulfide isomerase